MENISKEGQTDEIGRIDLLVMWNFGEGVTK